MTHRIILRHLVFAGKGVDPCVLEFKNGLNVVYGASNTGKSFIVKALNFMLGGKGPLPNIEQRKPYDAVLLGMNVPELGDITLYRAIAGGPYQLFRGLHRSRPLSNASRKLSVKHDKKSDDSLSALLLKLLKIEAREVVKKTTTGEKQAFTFRSVVPYVLVGEEAMLAERSPVLSSQLSSWPAERSIMKTLLSGIDDSAVVSSPDPKVRKAIVSGKVELVDELLARVNEQIGNNASTREEIETQLVKLTKAAEDLHNVVKERQAEIDWLTSDRRQILDYLADMAAEIGELELTISRFNELDHVYNTDLKRLESIDEGGVMLLAMATRPCPLCGAQPEHQHQHYDLSETCSVHAAAKIEMEKIIRDQQALAVTTLSLKAEVESKATRRAQFSQFVERLDALLAELRPLEATMRRDYEALTEQHSLMSNLLRLLHEREHLTNRKTELLAEQKSPSKSTKLELGPSGALVHELAMVIQDVLHAWRYPGELSVSFDMEKLDIRLNGKLRTDNGKGVRAILHAAFKVGVLLFCHEKELPHPSFLVLDTPLLTYREPLKNPRHGDLTADEAELKASSLQDHFYAHLASLHDKAQFIILENVDPPADVDAATKMLFTGELGNGRFGLFPPC
jgi:chromosome segregation ATPase